ncbi:zinc finger protein 208 [Anoplophora glabripennis]|uniref:zinc finger protein 208 n=1 Tax=Anoplophora glabripennis TaxID=217634 RepID=UPI0008738B15|nr:zinc finger protein 208 [Anoplophora glabripennis]
MSSLDNIIINVHKITEDGMVVTSIRHELDPNTKELISRTYFTPENVSFNDNNDDKLHLNYQRFEVDEEVIKCLKLEDVQIVQSPDSSEAALDKKPVLNIPTMIRCQNCETNFPTKYQYQRHQCEFNAERVVLKADADVKDIDKGVRVKYVCTVCDKQFVSKNNLERHQAGHENTQDNICEHCNKQFVSENRLRIHKENHCKKSGDISKFYRSDVTVWKCRKCHEVFSSTVTANYHVAICTEIIEFDADSEENKELSFLQEEIKSFASLITNGESSKDNSSVHVDDKNIEKILTEILLQCEFCNRTYAEKNLLLMHQRKHTTGKNYECVNCNLVFDSYAVAAQHWMKKCSEYVSLFYLPKLTYCEYCDRTFKSHELLYTHKIKKKHYTPKLHIPNTSDHEKKETDTKEKALDNKQILNKLIEDVLKTLDVPVNKINNVSPSTINEDSNKENVEPEKLIDLSKVKTEVPEASCGAVSQQEAPEKKKRGRKRKWPKNQSLKLKKFCAEVDDGFKYQCERCIKVFGTIVDLETHREKEHAASFTCEECGQVLHSAKALLIHSRAHKSLKPYVCETCGRSYSQTSHLWQHMRFHQGIKPFACPHEGCEARYTIRPDLKDHIRKVHTRERPFRCTVCDKCFLTGSVYYQHRLIHTNDRRYGCDLCPKRFFRADALNNHRRIHTDERPYPCQVCGREFRQKGDRNKHLRTQHPDAIIL